MNNNIKPFKKNKKYVFFIFLLILLITIYWVFNINTTSNSLHIKDHFLSTKKEYVYYSNNITINIYNTLKEKLIFKFKANQIQHFLKQDIIQFTQPYIIIADKKNITKWQITANQAQLDQKKNLYLYGYVHIVSLSNQNTQSIITNQITINLVTQNIFTNKKIIIHDYHFYSISTTMNSNLYDQKINLPNNTQTYYDIIHTQ